MTELRDAESAALMSDVPRVPALDGVRAIAVLLVVGFHTLLGSATPQLGDGQLRAFLAGGYTGVDLFFVLSGLLLFLPLTRTGGRMADRRAYFIRRAARILPAYYAALILVVIFNPWVTSEITQLPWQSTAGAASFALHLAFLQHNVGFLIQNEGFGGLTVAWTLTIEVIFYALLPWLGPRVWRAPWRWLAGAWLLSFGWIWAATHLRLSAGWLGAGGLSDPAVFLLQLILVTQMPTYAAHFVTGMVVARLLRVQPPRLSARREWVHGVAVLACLVGLAAVVAYQGDLLLTQRGGPYHMWANSWIVVVPFAPLLFCLLRAPAFVRRVLATRLPVVIGEASYGIYLSHLAIIGAVRIVLGVPPDGRLVSYLALTGVTLIGSLLYGLFSLTAIEAPARAWARRWRHREPVTSTASVPFPASPQ